MAIIVTQTADNAYHIQDAFRRINRDYYPLEVYQALYAYISNTHGADEPYQFDAIAWYCDLREVTFDDLDDHDDFDDHADYLRSTTPVLYVDYDDKTIYHLAYYS